MQTEQLLEERGKTHGRFYDHATCTQNLKVVLKVHLHHRASRDQQGLTDQQLESLDMIMHKIGRIIAGDPNFQDHWDDIAGYAMLANKSF